MEHITTMDAVKFVESCKEGIVVNYLEVVVSVL
jgi:dihydroorotase